MTGTVIATAARILWRMLERRGIDPTPLFNEAGLDTENLNDPRVRYSIKQTHLVWTRASEMLGDPGFGLTIAQVWQPGDFHALGCAFLASSTLRCALNRLVRYNALVYGVISYSVVERDDHAILSYSAENGVFNEPAILEDTRWAVVLDACRRVYGEDLDPLEVAFLHSEPDSARDKFSEYFRCPVRFGEPVATMTFPADVLDKPLPASNREVALTLDRTLSEYLAKLQRDDIVSRTRATIGEYLPSGNLTDKVVADALQLSPRTLQRKLAAEDTTFRKLVETVRHELAETYLADGSFTLIEISYMLGFSEQSSFSRAFKRWTGFTPQEFRRSA
jgi:AraC-like DNA-binding protein